jgi:hypothetical protein
MPDIINGREGHDLSHTDRVTWKNSALAPRFGAGALKHRDVEERRFSAASRHQEFAGFSP